MPRVRTKAPEQCGEQLGLICAKCGSHQFRVIYVRPLAHGVLKRRRECLKCRERITTRESLHSKDFRR